MAATRAVQVALATPTTTCCASPDNTVTPDYWKQATREISARDAVLKKLIPQFKGLALGSRGDAFATLSRAIVGQQISVKAYGTG